MTDNITPFVPKIVASAPGEPNPKVIEMLEIALQMAKDGVIEFAALVCMPSDGSGPIISAAGVADPYRVIGALMHANFQHIGIAHSEANKS